MSLHLVRHESARDFLALNYDFLMQKEVENGLLLGLGMSFAQNETGDRGNPLLISLTQDGIPFLCAFQTPPKRLIVVGNPGFPGEAAAMMQAYFAKENLSVPGLVGSKEFTERLGQLWSGLSGKVFKIAFDQCLFKLEQVIEPPYPEGNFRPAREADLELLTRWMSLFEQEVFLLSEPPGQRPRHTLRKIHAGELFVWESGKVVCMCAVDRPTPNGITINFVYTPPEARGKGYASACVALTSKKMLKKYKFCMLYTDLANPVSNRIYQRMGYKAVVRAGMYDFLPAI